MNRRTAGVTADFDRQVPALLVKVGKAPLGAGFLGAIRTLGRVGVPVYAITEPRLTPAGSSRYCTRHFAWTAGSDLDPGRLAAELLDFGRMIGRPSVLIAFDDESAALISEHAAALSESFLFPRLPAQLPRQLASKGTLYQLCREHGVPAPATSIPATAAEVEAFAATASFPVVVKNAAVRDAGADNPTGAEGSASGTRVLRDPGELRHLVRSGSQPPGFILQEYIPAEHADDWFGTLYRGADTGCELLFTGLRARSWPPQAGVTACGYSLANPEVAALTELLCKDLGYSGIADIEWRLDRRDGQYKLVDFNPRVGNQFRLFETEAGIDVVRALHLDLTGRPVPAGPQCYNRRLVVEHLDIPARLSSRRRGKRDQARAARTSLPQTVTTEYAWLSADDPLPVGAALTCVPSLVKIMRRGRGQLRPIRAGQEGEPVSPAGQAVLGPADAGSDGERR
jgi:D-aspartate ligase